MTSFSMYEWFLALVIGAAMGLAIVAATNSRLRSSNADVLQALQQSMGHFHSVCLFIMGSLPVVCVWLVGWLKTAPTALDAVAMIAMIGLTMVASFTLYGNLTKVLGGRISPVQSR
jgi:hypothetical protein